jgi:hypothetical protein
MAGHLGVGLRIASVPTTTAVAHGGTKKVTPSHSGCKTSSLEHRPTTEQAVVMILVQRSNDASIAELVYDLHYTDCNGTHVGQIPIAHCTKSRGRNNHQCCRANLACMVARMLRRQTPTTQSVLTSNNDLVGCPCSYAQPSESQFA